MPTEIACYAATIMFKFEILLPCSRMDPSALPKAFFAIHKYPPKSLDSRIVMVSSIFNEYSFIGVSDILYLMLGIKSPPAIQKTK